MAVMVVICERLLILFGVYEEYTRQRESALLASDWVELWVGLELWKCSRFRRFRVLNDEVVRLECRGCPLTISLAHPRGSRPSALR